MKRTLIYLLVGALIMTGIVAVSAVLFGSFSITQGKILFTTISIFFYSIVGLSCNTLIGGKYERVGQAGILAAVIGAFVAIGHTWTIASSGEFLEHLQLRGILFFIGIAFAHGSLMLLISPRNKFVSSSVFIALTCNLLFTAIIILQISTIAASATNLSGSVQFQIILCIICVVTTITAPLINRFS